MTRAYCLYKLARPHEAAEALNELANEEEAARDPEQERARQVLEAQLVRSPPLKLGIHLETSELTRPRAPQSYRLGEYERARDLFDELAATAELVSLCPRPLYRRHHSH